MSSKTNNKAGGGSGNANKKESNNAKSGNSNSNSAKKEGKDKKEKLDKAAKLAAKKARQTAKQEKVTKKRNKKELRDTGEDDIEKIIAEFVSKDKARVAVTVTICQQPSPRSNFSMTALPNGEMLLFGGEYCDGESTTVFNELFRWNVEKNEWKQIESLNTPPPRCSHQAVFYKDRVYIFGGEYATLDQFHHYRDLWSLDLKTNAWTEIKPAGDCPTARSGHRMVVWRNYLVLFGGFYEAMRDVRWYNDLYLFSFQDERWTQIQYRPHAQVPKPRSGVQMCVYANEDTIFIYGGYSKEKLPGQKKEGKIHEDMWMLNLRPVLGTVGSSSVGGKQSIDAQKAVWQKVSKKGHSPSPRCGAVMNLYKNKGILFGGVYDDEGLQHSMISTFYNDMYAFDLERKRWYQLGIRSSTTETAEEKKAKRAAKRAAKAAASTAATAVGSDSEQEESDDSDDDDDEIDMVKADMAQQALNNNMFGYIDESGAVIYIDMEDDPDAEPTEAVSAAVPFDVVSDSLPGKVENMSIVEAPPAVPSVSAVVKPKAAEVASSQPMLKAVADVPPPATELPSGAVNCQANLSKYFLNRTEPSPRINPCIMIRGSTLYVYGGVTELGDVEITLDDCWTLDLNKRDKWKQVLQGTMHLLVWKGEDYDTGTEASEGNDSEDDSDSDDDDDDDDEDDSSDEEETVDAPVTDASNEVAEVAVAKSSKVKEKHQKKGACEDFEKSEQKEKSLKKKSKSELEAAGETEKAVGVSRRQGHGGGGGSGSGLRAEIEKLREQMDATDVNRTPLSGEALRAFYSRTSEYWSAQVVCLWNERKAVDNSVPILTEKEIKREGFLLSEIRYNELLPMLARLNELEEQQNIEEEEAAPRDRRKGSSKKR